MWLSTPVSVLTVLQHLHTVWLHCFCTYSCTCLPVCRYSVTTFPQFQLVWEFTEKFSTRVGAWKVNLRRSIFIKWAAALGTFHIKYWIPQMWLCWKSPSNYALKTFFLFKVKFSSLNEANFEITASFSPSHWIIHTHNSGETTKYRYVAVSRKVVWQRGKSLHDNVESHYG